MKNHTWEIIGPADSYFNNFKTGLYIWKCKDCGSLVISYNEPIVCGDMIKVSCLSLLSDGPGLVEDESIDIESDLTVLADCNQYLIKKVMDD